MSDEEKCRGFECKNKPTQKLTMKTSLLESREHFEEGAVWNSRCGYLCDECSSKLFDTRHDQLWHGFKDLKQ